MDKIGQKVADFFNEFKPTKDPEGGVRIGKLGSFSVTNVPTNLKRYFEAVKNTFQSMVRSSESKKEAPPIKATTTPSARPEQAATATRVTQSASVVTSTWISARPSATQPLPTVDLTLDELKDLRKATTPEAKDEAMGILQEELQLPRQAAEVLLSAPSLDEAFKQLEERGINQNLLGAMKNTWIEESPEEVGGNWMEKEIETMKDITPAKVTRVTRPSVEENPPQDVTPPAA